MSRSPPALLRRGRAMCRGSSANRYLSTIEEMSMNNGLRRFRVSNLKTGLPLLVFARSAWLAGGSTGSKLEDSVSRHEEQALVTIPPPDPLINSHFGSAVAADAQTLI